MGVAFKDLCIDATAGYERLYTFNKAGQSTYKVLRQHTGTCCAYQNAFAGHFRTGYAETLFFYGRISPEATEYLQDITAGGNSLMTPAPQINGEYTPTIGDFDGNGFDDVLLWNRSGATYLLSSDGASFTRSDPSDIPKRAQVFAVTVTPS